MRAPNEDAFQLGVDEAARKRQDKMFFSKDIERQIQEHFDYEVWEEEQRCRREERQAKRLHDRITKEQQATKLLGEFL